MTSWFAGPLCALGGPAGIQDPILIRIDRIIFMRAMVRTVFGLLRWACGRGPLFLNILRSHRWTRTWVVVRIARQYLIIKLSHSKS